MGDPQSPGAYIFRETSGDWQWWAGGKSGMKSKRHLAMKAAEKALEKEAKKQCQNRNGIESRWTTKTR